MPTSNPTVYVTQVPHSRKPGTRDYAPTLDISAASEYGRVETLFGPKTPYMPSDMLAGHCAEQLKNFDPATDSLLAMGDPVIAATALGILARAHGHFCVLRYDRIQQRYLRMEISTVTHPYEEHQL